ncbi:protein Spindly [Salarias fasciatus]|uniref:Protein Spindly n=1 Tax=Salarias fasciatus TaxID=181472 RepID=A0A672GQF4_SALFA|nr:protein Spindly-like [Salarias fasciatus]XP_029965076.1 protein Spindly-like [Salarias fasciatus]XP_029965085.1 protein Spindly-like [Salarias fasciatus]
MAAPQEELELLRAQLKEREEQVHRAAQAGLDLLNQQLELQTRLDEQQVEASKALEALEQDKYSLQKEVELKARLLEALQSDHECVKKQQSRQLQEQQERLERSHSAALAELHSKLLRVQASLDESQLSEKQLKHKLELQTETLSLKLEELRALSEQAHSSMSAEVMEAQIKMLDLESAKEELQRSLQESVYREQQLQLSSSSLQRQLLHLTEEKEEREREAVSWFNALEKSRELNRDLQLQLDQVLQEAQDPNSKGNSLFAELEDRRADMERQLISMRVQYQALQKIHAFSKQQMQRMKVQMATLMQLQGSRADPAQLERLQAMLSQKNGEIHGLMSKLQRLERLEVLLKSQPANPAPPEDGEEHDETYYTDLLKMKLSNSVKDVERLGDELSLQRMKSLSESQRALELERKLFRSEQLLKQTQSDKFKLQLRVEELQNKYEPKEAKKSLQKRKKEKLPVDVSTSSEDTRPDKPRHTVATATDETDAKAAEPEAENRPEEPDPKADLRPAKCVRISDSEPAVIPEPSSPLSQVEENPQRRDQRWRRQEAVEILHVRSDSSRENQCAQQ